MHTKSIFGWGDHDIRVYNACRYPIRVVVQAVSDTGEEFGSIPCRDGWCAAQATVAPYQTTGKLLGTDQGGIYTSAYVDYPGIDWSWGGTEFCETFQLSSCAEGDEGCFCFSKVS